ncbi:response regulator transcription factor [Neomegalonema sp.]|uniref:response regulator transcription factor n=1 Tax=Neomegalonema sp. TaxID=2039713 RepID=UPI002617ADA6|nr:response regulator transcription factor [Neomegalonema sp.]MDD2867294.1 response regulator transcription factor [Neomegalonema sp.]
MTRILIVEDDADIASLLRRGFAAEGYDSAWEQGSAEALARLKAERFDAAVVDMMLGEESGADLLAEMRLRGHMMPALVLSALSRVEDRAQGLQAGAQDYVVKPFQLSELLARLRVQLLRAAPKVESLRLGDLRYDPETRTVSGGAGGRKAALTEREGELLAWLIANAGKLLTRAEIFAALWSPHGGATENVVDVYLGYLRRKLAPLSDYGLALRTLRGRGFMLTRDDEEEET